MNKGKRLLGTLLLFALISRCCAGAEWLADYDLALKKAHAEHKAVLMDFTGSDWCPWCMKLKNEVFDTPEFDSYADANLVLVIVDFPRRWKLSTAQEESNRSLAHKYGVKGYPTVVILDSDGKRIGTSGYYPGGPKVFLGEISKIPGLKQFNSRPSARASDVTPDPPRHAPEFVPIAPTVPNHYDALALKGISGSAKRRMALINGETFMAGDTAKVHVKDGKVEVTCKEVRENSVLIVVDGKLVELKMRDN